MSSTSEIVAILTGDLVKSSRLPAGKLRQLPTILGDVASTAQQGFGRALVPRTIDVFRGDGWQWLVTEPAKALRLALFVRATLRGRHSSATHKMDTRIAIGLGPVGPLPPARLSQGHGAAFEASGRALENMSKRARLAVARSAGAGSAPSLEAPLVALVDFAATNWTGAQARAVAGALAGRTQEEIAAAWKPEIHRSAVARHLERAGWEALAAGLDAWENVTSGGHNKPM